MRITQILAPCLLALPLLAQTQIGAGSCNSATLDGTYSLTLSGRSVSGNTGQELFKSVLQGVGTISFDGLSKVSATLVENTNTTASPAGTIGAGPNPVQLAGTYSIQANCIGTVNLTSGDTATFTLVVYDLGADYLITGGDGTYSFTGSGNTMPTAACANSTLNGSYSFNGNDFELQSQTISAAGYISGVLVFDGAGNVTGNWSLAPALFPAGSVSGTYTVASGCTAAATIKDNSGNSYSVAFTITAASGAFIVNVENAQFMMIGSGRPL